jgi:membrane protein required for colicin V production
VNWVDYLIVAILLFSTLMSARKRFAREIVGLAAAFLALILGMWFYGSAGSFLIPYASSRRLADLGGFLIVVAAVLLCGWLLGQIVSRFLRTVGLSFFDRLFGAAFGLVRGLLIATAMLTAFTAFGPQVDSKTISSSSVNTAVLHSRIVPYVLKASRLFVAVAPMELKSAFLKQYAQVKLLLQKNPPPRND